ncbi:hypothetical protein ACHAWU_007736 [Discostella pseudostelligera]|uniref:Helicase-associated domain-containing protein n=1 Tax=Discostella pseudostelligera TaxID=259834 RepID=A0ABD3LYR7_9STRA
MSAERVQLLESIGFKWTMASGQELWDEYYNKLVAFKAQNGHCNVPTRPNQDDYTGMFLDEMLL